jgi:uncharacterized protein YhaN
MRIRELQLRAFGPFTNMTLNLEKGNEGLHILYGPNEAGKSSALRALKALLYGIPHNSTDNFIHNNKDIRIGGRLSNSDGSELAFLRRKGNKNTLLDLDEKVINDSILDNFLQGVTEDAFSILFGIDHKSLVVGGQNILQGEGEIGRSLFSASSGGANLRQILQSFETEADALYRSRGQNQIINKALTRYYELKKKIAELSFSSREWAEIDKELKKAMTERTTLQNEMDKLAAEGNRLRRLHAVIPMIGTRRELVARLEKIGDVIILPDDFTNKRHEAQQQFNTAQEIKRRAELDLERLNADLSLIVLPFKILDQAEAIENMHQRLGQHRKATTDLGTLKGSLQQNKIDVKKLMFEFRPDLDVESARKKRPKSAVKTRVQKLGSQRESLKASLDRAMKDVRGTTQALSKLLDEMNSLESPKDVLKLKKVLTKVQKSGDLTTKLKETVNGLKTEEAQIKNQLKQLPLWTLTFEELGAVPVPSSETISRFEDAFSGLEVQLKNIDDRLEGAYREQKEIEQQIDVLKITGAVPTEEDLERVRGKRQEGWSLVRRVWLNREDVEEEIRMFDPERDLAEAYEVSVTQADDIADRLRRESTRVADYASLLTRLTRVQEDIEKWKADRHEVEQSEQKYLDEWNNTWKPAGIKPLTPREMRSWLDTYGKLLQRIDKLDEYKADILLTKDLIKGHRVELNQCLETVGEEPSPTEESFNALVERFEMVLENLEKINRRNVELERKIADSKLELQQHMQTKEDTEKKIEEWQVDWDKSMEALGLAPGISPEEAFVILSKLDELFTKIDEQDSLKQRILGIDRDTAEFTSMVKSLVEHVAPELSNLPPEQSATQLNAELARARTESTKHVQLTKEVTQKKRSLHEAENAILLATEKLNNLCVQAGCASHDELEIRERDSSNYQNLRKEIDSIERQIIELSGGIGLQQILHEAEMIDIDTLHAQIDAMENEFAELKKQHNDLGEKIGSLRNELGRIDGSSAATAAAEEAQEYLASIRESVDDYVKVRLASIVLRQAIENYRAKNQGPLLSRASELFSRLTLGSFAGLKTDYNACDEPILQGVRSNGNSVDVYGMSDGTIDQLYLALRLATVEKYLESNEPIPFIVDDILIRFDDDRAKATLMVLADLSKKTQVLFFTHHTRLVELSQGMTNESGLYVYQIN